MKQYKWGGEIKSKTILADANQKPMTIKELAKNINDYFWYRRQVSEGTKGPIVYEFTRRRIILSLSGLPQREVSLLIRRTIDGPVIYSYFISNASSSVQKHTLDTLLEQIAGVQIRNHRALSIRQRKWRDIWCNPFSERVLT